MKRFYLLLAILLVLLVIGFLLWWFLGLKEPAVKETDPSPPPPVSSGLPVFSQQTDSLASEELQSGLVAEVTRVVRGKDRFVEVRWQYRNPTEQGITLCSNDEGKALIAGLYCSSGGKKFAPIELPSGKRLASEIRWTNVPPGKSVLFWAKFDIPAENPHVAFFVPGLMLPMEDLAVSQDAIPSARQTSAEVLAAEPHIRGLIVEVLRVRRTPEGFVEVRWRYRNQTNQTIQLFDTGEGQSLPSRVFLVDDATGGEHLVHRDKDGVAMASRVAFTTVAPGKSATFFARFPGLPQASGSITFYVPDTPPLAGLEIE